MIVLGREEWRARMQAHHDRVAAHADAFVARRSRGAQHPVHDYAPVKIETAAGRAQYEREQRELAAQATPLRERLKSVCEGLLLMRQ